MNHAEIIEKLGGTAEVARMCEVKMPSVSEWKTTGIPKARLMFLKAVHPQVFEAEVVTGPVELATTQSTAEQGA